MSRHHVARAQASARRAWAPTVAAGEATCRRCDQPIKPGQPWDVGHLHDLALGGDPFGPTQPEHARRADCTEDGNRSAGARLGNELRPRRRRRLAQWLGFFDDGGLPQPRAAAIFPPEPRRDSATRAARFTAVRHV